jgi:serine-type D-Ala-D-Ala carboxypeptidase (penicillin-binding protein 5/6)
VPVDSSGQHWSLRTLIAAAAAVFAMSFVVSPAASADIEPAGAVALPDGPAQAWLVADLDTGRILGSRDPYTPHAPASTIKVLLAIVALDQLNLNSAIMARPANTRVECSCAGIEPGRVYTARQLLDALLLVSGNDAANTLADMLGGFRVAVAKMNAKAFQLGARSTRASTPSGLDGPRLESVTTAHDLAVIFRTALAYPMFAHIIRQPSALFPDGSGYKEIKNQNELLQRYPGALGGKTGYTNIARKTYVGAAQRNSRRLVVVQMYGTGDLYGQAMGLLDWGFSQYR